MHGLIILGASELLHLTQGLHFVLAELRTFWNIAIYHFLILKGCGEILTENVVVRYIACIGISYRKNSQFK